MQASDLLNQAPLKMNTLKKSVYPIEELALEFPFELDTEEEQKFYETLRTNDDSYELLWYENDKKAFRLFVVLDEEEGIAYYIHVLDILGQFEDGTNDYDGGDPDYLGDMSFKEAVDYYLKFIESYKMK